MGFIKLGSPHLVTSLMWLLGNLKCQMRLAFVVCVLLDGAALDVWKAGCLEDLLFCEEC